LSSLNTFSFFSHGSLETIPVLDPAFIQEVIFKKSAILDF
jgi:hypothetical protein